MRDGDSPQLPPNTTVRDLGIAPLTWVTVKIRLRRRRAEKTFRIERKRNHVYRYKRQKLKPPDRHLGMTPERASTV
jgi:hypothetical protein